MQGSVISEVKIAPNYSPIPKAAGIPNLKQERSENARLGFTFIPMPELSFTVEGYIIKVKDSVVLSGQFSASDPTLDPALMNAPLNNLHVSFAQFFCQTRLTQPTVVWMVIDYTKNVEEPCLWPRKMFQKMQNQVTCDNIIAIIVTGFCQFHVSGCSLQKLEQFKFSKCIT
ncbi:MAG: hypothetical protein JWQ54_1112 [Mucilaginibacter sp.]|nr:hypothetical protein [Mucilaginibacter sp.]